MCSSVNPPIPPLLAHSPIHSPITLPPSHLSVYSHFHSLLPPSHLAIHYCLHPSTHSSPHSSTRLFSCEDRCARLCARLTADGVAPLWDDVRADRKQYGVALRTRARSQAVPSLGRPLTSHVAFGSWVETQGLPASNSPALPTEPCATQGGRGEKEAQDGFPTLGRHQKGSRCPAQTPRPEAEARNRHSWPASSPA